MIDTVTPDIQSLAQLLEETLTHDPRDPQRIRDDLREYCRLGVDVLPFDINRSALTCAVEAEQAIRVGFSLLAPAQSGFITTILTERLSGGAFTSLQDFCERLEPDNLPDDFLRRAIQIGGFDSIEPSRARLLQGRQMLMRQVRRAKEERRTGQFSLFAQPAAGSQVPIPLPNVAEWTEEERIAQEEAALGFSFEACLLDIEIDDDDETPQADEADEIKEAQPDSAPEEMSADMLIPARDVVPPSSSPEPSSHAADRTPPEPELLEQAPEPVESPPPDFDAPPLPPCEFTADDYEAAFPEGLGSGAEKTSVSEEIFEAHPPTPHALANHGAGLEESENLDLKTGDESQHPQLVIQLSTLTATERTIARLHTILRQYPGHVPVCFHCIDLENHTTVVPAHSAYATDASDACLNALAAITGYHALKLRDATA